MLKYLRLDRDNLFSFCYEGLFGGCSAGESSPLLKRETVV